MKDKRLEILFTPLTMRNLKVKNRFFMAPMGTTFQIDQLIPYMVARAKGEVALITTGEMSVHPGGRVGSGGKETTELCLEKDSDIRPLARLTKAVQDSGTKIIAQLSHAGRYSFEKLLGRQSVAPSPIPSRYTGETPRELSTVEVDELVVAFARAAVRARNAGFDGVEILGSIGYLISQFLSPLTNKREDKYGGDTLQRGTFLISILEELRKEVGDDFHVCVKLDAEDGMDGGITLSDSSLLVPKLVEAGVDRLHIWAGWHEALRPMLTMSVARGAFSHLAAEIKRIAGVPVCTVGRINDPFVAANIIEQGHSDMVGLGRPLLCDPEFVKKTSEGRVREIRRCTACCFCFDQVLDVVHGHEKPELKCSLNPELGREGENLVRPAAAKKNIVVVGGGPAGMEVARVAGLRGHRVTLLEKDSRLGGMISLALVPPHKDELRNIIDYYVCQLEKIGVDVQLGISAQAEIIRELEPDIIIMAIGAKALIPQLPGIRNENVVSALDVLKGHANVGKKVVIVGGGLIGIETGEYLLEQGKNVTIVEALKAVGTDIGPTSRWNLLGRIRKKATILTLTEVVEIKESAVVVSSHKGDTSEIGAESVIIATGLKSDDHLENDLDQTSIPIFRIGSCRKPGMIADAIFDAFGIGYKI